MITASCVQIFCILFCFVFFHKPLVIVADLTSDADCQRIIDDVLSHFKKIDILVS